MSPEFHWMGDLDDDCVCRVPGYFLHAEDMGDAWYCSVGRTDGPLNAAGNGETIFHTSEDNILPLTGPAAMKLAEMAVLADMVDRLTARYEALTRAARKAEAWRLSRELEELLGRGAT